MPDAAEKAKYAAEEKAIRDKWMRQNPQASQPKPQVTREPGGKSAVKGEYPIDRKFVLPEPEPLKVQENLPKPTPYMAMDVDKYGQPFFGTGLQGWARKAWADLTDPLKYFQDQKKLSQEAQDRITKEYEAGRVQAGKIIEDKLKWSQWGQKMFGITSEELGAIAPLGKAERAIATEAGDSVAGTAVARTARIALDTTQNFVWGGLAVLGLGDQAMRKVHSTVQGLDYVADKFNKDEPDNFVEKMVAASAVGMMKDAFTVAGAINDGKLKWSDAKETIDQYKAGSEMVYSMMFANGARAEFEKGLSEGKDPEILAQNLGSMGIEMAGSILGDPTTYLGLSLVRPVNIFTKAGRESGTLVKLGGKISFRLPWRAYARIPEFGEIIGATVGKARFAADVRYMTNVVEGLENVLGKTRFVAGELDAAKLGDEAVEAVLKHYASDAPNTLDKMVIGKGANEVKVLGRKVWNFFAYDTESKVNMVARDANMWISNLLDKENGIDNAFLVLNDMITVRKGGDLAREAASRLIAKGSQVFSPVGEMVGDIVSKLSDEKLFDLMIKHQDDRVRLHDELFKRLGSIVQAYVPSVDEMYSATKTVEKLKLTGAAPDANTARFAAMYNDVPWAIKQITNITKNPRIVSGKVSSAMVRMYMQFVPRSWSRNIQGAFIPMASRVGLVRAFETALTAGAGLSKGGTDFLLSKIDNEIETLVGFVPSEEGIAKIVQDGKGIFRFGMLGSIRRSEQLMGRKIIAQAARDAVQQALPAVVKNLPEWDAVVGSLPKESQSLMFAAFERADGDIVKAERIVRDWIGTGEIPVHHLVEPSPNLKSYLQSNGMYEKFREIQTTAKTSEEFASQIDEIVVKWKDAITSEYNKLEPAATAWVKYDDFGARMAETFGKGSVEKKQMDVFTGLVTAWDNTRKKMDEALFLTQKKLNKIAFDSGDPKLFAAFTKMQDSIKAMADGDAPFRITTEIRSMFYKDIDSLDLKDPQAIQDFFNKVYEKGSVKFSLAQVYPDIAPTADNIKKLGWPAYFEFAADQYLTGNTKRYTGTMDILEETMKEFGKSVDDLVGSAPDSPFAQLHEYLQEAEMMEQKFAWDRFFRQYQFKNIKDETPFEEAVSAYQKRYPTWTGDVENFLGEMKTRANKRVTVIDMANKYGIATATNDGKPLNKKILNIINAQLKKFASASTMSIEEKAKIAKQLIKEHSPISFIGGRGKGNGMTPGEFYLIFGEKYSKMKRGFPVGFINTTDFKDKYDTAGNLLTGLDRIREQMVAGKFFNNAEEATDDAIIDLFTKWQQNPAEMAWQFADPDLRDAEDQLSLLYDGYSNLEDIPLHLADDMLKRYADENGIVKAVKAQPVKATPVEFPTTAKQVDSVLPDPALGDQPYFDDAGELRNPKEERAALLMQEAWQEFQAMPTGYVHPEGQMPHESVVLYNSLKGFERDVKGFKDTILKEFGMTTKTMKPGSNFDGLMSNLRKAIKPRMDQVKLEAAVTGVSTRNFVLHDYNKTYMDHAMTLLLGNSFHYWTSRTYARALESIVENPKYANMYMQYKEYNVKRHSDQPDWYRQNLQIDSVFGIPLKNPLFMNLESAINPMYGLTGVDFNDPRKRVDWMSRAVDDMNKMGPTFSPLVSWGIGLAMFNKGEEEAGQRWFGRMLPQTALIKEATSKYLGKAIELDPFVKFLEGGVDPYERNRVAAALANMVAAGEISQEQMIEAARNKEGDIWDLGVEAAATARFSSSASSFFFGAGLKPRTQQDMLLEKFWQDYSTMVSSSSMMTPEQYRQSWDNMRDNEDYGMFMDALLLSRKSGAAMESAYAYNVFSRVPPGELNGILETVGIRPDLVQAFYDNKGDFSKMNLLPQDKERFMAGAIDIGAILALPDNATREEWGAAKDQYKVMNSELQKQFGEGILDLMSDYYSAPERDVFLDDNPDVRAAMELKDAYVLNNPRLMQYYGGISTMERYYKTIMERDLAKVYGKDIREIETEYYDLLTTQEQKAFKKEHPELKKYWEDKKIYQDKLDRRIVVFGSNLKPAPTPRTRPDAVGGNVPQENLMNLQQNQRSAEEWTQELGQPMMELIYQYWQGEKLPSPVKSQLDYKANKYGAYDGDQLLQMILMSLQ